MIKNPWQSKPDLSEISDKDRKLIDAFNKTETPIPDYLVQNFFENQSAIFPDKAAVVSGDKSLTYKDLDDRANQLARHLKNLNLVSGEVVGIYLERSVEMIVSVLGVLKAGGCYLPIDPLFPDERICYMFEDAGAKIMISQDSFKEKFGYFTGASFFLIDSESAILKSHSIAKPDINITPQSFAYILYTSGSTGKPKGVKIHHQAVVNFINSMIRSPGINENDVLLAVTTLSFDISVLEIFLPLSRGATVVIASTRDTTDGEALTELIKKHGITFLQATPSLWNLLLSSGWKGNKNMKGICGGEALSSGLVRQVLPEVGEFWNFYGPTETTVWSTGIRITDPDAPILIGKPIDNTKIYILDNNNKLLPAGETGEICIGGLGVAKGYVNNPEITAQKFISFEDRGIIYKTGDLGRFHQDGNLEIFGRIDNQIKLKGYRIEPGEIESILTRLEGVREAVVKLHKFDENDERLVAFLNVGYEFKMTDKEIFNFLVQKLPYYMIPRFFQQSDGFPRMPNGKISKKALLFEIKELERKGNQDMRTLSPTEKIILGVWQDALKVKDISTTDNFFEIGGTSQLAVSVFSRIESHFHVELGLRVFFDSPRIKDLGEIIDITLQKPVKNNHGDKEAKPYLKIIKGEI